VIGAGDGPCISGIGSNLVSDTGKSVEVECVSSRIKDSVEIDSEILNGSRSYIGSAASVNETQSFSRCETNNLTAIWVFRDRSGEKILYLLSSLRYHLSLVKTFESWFYFLGRSLEQS
jgi:hypothetical protein